MKVLAKTKRIVTIMIMLILVMGMAQVASAKTVSVQYKSSGKTHTYKGTYYKVYYDNIRVNTLDSTPGLMIEGNYMVPLKRSLVNHGAMMKYSYYKPSQRITLKYNNKTVKVWVGKKTMEVNNIKKVMDIALTKVRIKGKTILYIPAKAMSQAFELGYSYSNKDKAVWLRSADKKTVDNDSTPVVTDLQATDFKSMTIQQFLDVMGPICQKDYQKTGILASVSLAQAINESGWGKSGLSQSSNNLFGMKISLSGNGWTGSAWDGKSYTSVMTTEEVNGKKVQVEAKFRKYNNVQESINDHSAYLLNATNGIKKRYAGIASATTYEKQLSIIKNGGYCTWSSYYTELKNLIVRYDLTKWDKK